MMRQRILILPVAAVIVIALCAFKLMQRYEPAEIVDSAIERRRAPTFELYDQYSKLVKLERYMHRHRILLVFFDGSQPVRENEFLARLLQDDGSLAASETVVVGVSAELPQVIRRQAKIPFSMLSDVPGPRDLQAGGNPLSVHRLWGRLDPQTNKPMTGVFLIDRTGTVAWEREHPRPLSNPHAVIADLFAGKVPRE